MTTQPAAPAPVPATVAPVAGPGPAWLHVVVAWSLAVLCVVFVGVLALLHDAIPTALLVVTGASVGGALGLTSPLSLLQGRAAP